MTAYCNQGHPGHDPRHGCGPCADEALALHVERPGRGLPGIARAPRPTAPRHLEATVILTDGRTAVEHTERNDPAGLRAMDRWAFERNADPGVDYIAVARVARVAGYRKESA